MGIAVKEGPGDAGGAPNRAAALDGSWGPAPGKPAAARQRPPEGGVHVVEVAIWLTADDLPDDASDAGSSSGASGSGTSGSGASGSSGASSSSSGSASHRQV